MKGVTEFRYYKASERAAASLALRHATVAWAMVMEQRARQETHAASLRPREVAEDEVGAGDRVSE